MSIDRRSFFQKAAAAIATTMLAGEFELLEGIWQPGRKSIIIPAKTYAEQRAIIAGGTMYTERIYFRGHCGYFAQLANTHNTPEFNVRDATVKEMAAAVPHGFDGYDYHSYNNPHDHTLIICPCGGPNHESEPNN